MPALIATFALGLLAACFAAYLQHRYWRHRHYEETWAREFKEVCQIIDSISAGIDRRLVAQGRFALEIKRPKDLDGAFTEHVDSVEAWMRNFNANRSKIYLYFGAYIAYQFEYGLHESIRRSSSIIGRSYRYKTRGLKLSHAHENEFRNIDTNLREARNVAYKFLKQLNRCVSEIKFGSIQHFNSVDSPDLSKVSRIYLMRRLLGLER
jgi:hypothetical protein